VKNTCIKHKRLNITKGSRRRLKRVKVSVQPVRGDILRKALDDLDLWGDQFSRAITRLLQAKGFVFDAKHYYSLSEINKVLTRLLGRENSRHILTVIEIGVQVQYFAYCTPYSE
jgi:hypothetical protein